MSVSRHAYDAAACPWTSRRSTTRTLPGEAAPHTEYVSPFQVRRLFAGFSSVEIDRRNFDSLPYVPRRLLLGTVSHALGLDLYITANR